MIPAPCTLSESSRSFGATDIVLSRDIPLTSKSLPIAVTLFPMQLEWSTVATQNLHELGEGIVDSIWKMPTLFLDPGVSESLPTSLLADQPNSSLCNRENTCKCGAFLLWKVKTENQFFR
jgi:hypothetical protein